MRASIIVSTTKIKLKKKTSNLQCSLIFLHTKQEATFVFLPPHLLKPSASQHCMRKQSGSINMTVVNTAKDILALRLADHVFRIMQLKGKKWNVG